MSTTHYLLSLPPAYEAFLAADGPKKYNGWYAPTAKGGYASSKLRFLVYKPTFKSASLELSELLERRMNAEDDPKFERHVKLVGSPDGALDVFDNVDGVANRRSLKGKFPFACFDGEGALVLDTAKDGTPVLQFDDEGSFKKIADSFDAFVGSLAKKAPPAADDDE